MQSKAKKLVEIYDKNESSVPVVHKFTIEEICQNFGRILIQINRTYP